MKKQEEQAREKLKAEMLEKEKALKQTLAAQDEERIQKEKEAELQFAQSKQKIEEELQIEK
jgi:hypothetical protein